jgi:hypothetical protein
MVLGCFSQQGVRNLQNGVSKIISKIRKKERERKKERKKEVEKEARGKRDSIDVQGEGRRPRRFQLLIGIS